MVYFYLILKQLNAEIILTQIRSKSIERLLRTKENLLLLRVPILRHIMVNYIQLMYNKNYPQGNASPVSPLSQYRPEPEKLGKSLCHRRQCLSPISCTPDKDICVFHLCLQILSHPCYLTQDRIKIMCM